MSGLIGGSSAKTLRVQEFRSSGIFTVPDGVKTVGLFLVGAGGGTGQYTYAAGQGGNVVETNYDVNGKATCAVVIGAGSAGNGGDSSFDGVVIAVGGAANGLYGSNTAPYVQDSLNKFNCGNKGFGGAGACSDYPLVGNPANGAKTNAAGPANSGAGASGANKAGGSGYCRVEWYE